MAVEKKLQGLHIVLILFIMLSIALCVTTVLAFKNYQEQEILKNNAIKAEAAAKKEQTRLEKNLADIKTVGGWDANYEVARILNDFNQDKVRFANTYGETTQDVYPKMLKVHIEKYKAVQGNLATELANVARLEAELTALKDEKDKVNTQHRTAEEALTTKLAARDEQLKDVQKVKTDFQNTSDTKYSDTVRDHTVAAGELKEKARLALEEKNRTSVVLAKTQSVMEAFRKGPIDGFSSPDGEIIETSATVGVVYVNRGRNDGLRRQTIFQVFDHDAQLKDASTLRSKGEIEITEIIGPHRAVARVITDTVSDPILPGDLIYSFIFRPGMPERFALSGNLDVNGDGISDLNRLRSLIQINGARLDAYVDLEGAIVGKLSESTRYLVVGDRPSRESEAAARESHDQLGKQAGELGVVKIPLERFLDYIGLQSNDQRYDLSHQVRDREDAEKTDKKETEDLPFRKRPERGKEGAF